jgi:hypothetical protein
MLEEKRARHRLQMDLPVLYKVSYQQSTAFKKAITGNISTSGIRFYTCTFHKKGTNLQIVLPHIFDSPRTCTVVWYSKKYHDLYKIGTHFLQDIS